MAEQDLRFVVVTGMSGAGKSAAIRDLEDLGFFCVDNLPPTLIPKFAELCVQSQGKIGRIAVVVDIRGREFFDSLFEGLESLEKSGFSFQILFLEAQDEVLVRRYKETRRAHPLQPGGRVLDGIREERSRLEALRGRAHIVLDTTNLSPQKLKEELRSIFSQDAGQDPLLIQIVTFGFKFGLPLDADLVFDVRFLPNPYYVKTLRPLPGTDPHVQEYVSRWPITGQMIDRVFGLVEFLVPHYVNEGKSQLIIGIGCTGGRHRSVVVGARLAERLTGAGRRVVVEHRDIDRSAEPATSHPS